MQPSATANARWPQSYDAERVILLRKFSSPMSLQLVILILPCPSRAFGAWQDQRRALALSVTPRPRNFTRLSQNGRILRRDHLAWHEGEHQHLHCLLQLLHSFTRSSRSWRSSEYHVASGFCCFSWSGDLWGWASNALPHFRSLLMGSDFVFSPNRTEIFLSSLNSLPTNITPRERFCLSVNLLSHIFEPALQLACSSEQSCKWIKKIYINPFKHFQEILKLKQKNQSRCSTKTDFTTKYLYWQTSIFGWKRIIKIILTKFSIFCETICDITLCDPAFPKESCTCEILLEAMVSWPTRTNLV